MDTRVWCQWCGELQGYGSQCKDDCPMLHVHLPRIENATGDCLGCSRKRYNKCKYCVWCCGEIATETGERPCGTGRYLRGDGYPLHTGVNS